MSIRTALLKGAASKKVSEIESTAQRASWSTYDSHEAKHGHIDTEEEKNKVNEVLEGVDDTGLRMTILFLDKLSKIIISVFSFVAIACAVASVLGVLSLFLPRCMYISKYIYHLSSLSILIQNNKYANQFHSALDVSTFHCDSIWSSIGCIWCL